MSRSVSSPGGHVVDDRQRPQVLGADRQDLAVVVAALALDGGGVAGERAGLVGGELLQPLQVEHDLRWRARTADGDAALGQQLGDRHAVEVGELGQPLDGDRTVAALVGADDDRLPAAAPTSPPRRAATDPAAVRMARSRAPSALA